MENTPGGRAALAREATRSDDWSCSHQLPCSIFGVKRERRIHRSLLNSLHGLVRSSGNIPDRLEVDITSYTQCR